MGVIEPQDYEGRSREDLGGELAELSRRLEEFQFHLPDALVEAEILGVPRISYMNRMAFIVFGYEAADLEANIPVSTLFADGEYERAVAIVNDYVGASHVEGSPNERSGRQELFDFRMRRKDGSIFDAETQTSFTLDDERRPVRMRTLVRDVTRRVDAEREKERLITELKLALGKVQTLEGMLPICSSCKKVRDDDGYWERIEGYLAARSGLEFSHGLCPDCAEELYPGLSTRGQRE